MQRRGFVWRLAAPHSSVCRGSVIGCVYVYVCDRFFNDAMKIAPMNEVMPVFFVLFTLHAIIAAAIMYQEFRGISAVSIIVFIVGYAPPLPPLS